MAPSTRYRIEFTATTADFYPYRPFDYYHVDGWIVTAPEGVVCSVDYRPAVPITYIKGWSSAEREQRTGITPGYTHREGIMYLTLSKKLLFACRRTKAASLSVSEQWSVSENNKPERLEPIVQILHTAPYFEQLHILRALGFLASAKLANPVEQRQEVYVNNGNLESRHIIQNPNGNKTAVECDKDWPGLVRSLEVFRQNRQLPSWSVITEGTILAGNLVLPSSGKWSTYSYRMDENNDQVQDESFWHVEIKKAETLSPKPVHEWPEFLEAMKVIEQNKN
jgi:hypothetical protein